MHSFGWVAGSLGGRGGSAAAHGFGVGVGAGERLQLSGVEMGLALAGVPHKPGGVQAALGVLAAADASVAVTA